MKISAGLCLFVLSLGLVSPAQIRPRASDQWLPIAEGIDYQEFQLSTPNYVYVARMERNNPHVTLESGLAQGRLGGTPESVRKMAQRYNDSINYWGENWGQRSQIVVAINGYFFDTAGPWRGQIQSGWYVKRFDDYQNGSGFAWTLDRNAFIGGCVVHKPEKQLVRFLKTGKTMLLNGLNVPRSKDRLVLYTPQYAATTGTDANGLEVLVQVNQPVMLQSDPTRMTGTVRAVQDGAGNLPIPFDHIVLSASGSARQKLRAQHLHPGDTLGIAQELKHFDASCSQLNPMRWERTYTSIGGSFVFLENGHLPASFKDPGANLRNPRTAIAYNDQYIFFIVVDGRFPGFSAGMTMKELGSFARDRLAAQWGINQDGGGSSTMVVKGEVKNFPNAELKCYDFYRAYLPLIDQMTHPTPMPGQAKVQPPHPFIKPGVKDAEKCERPVANSLFMSVIQPKQLSVRFTPGAQVTNFLTSNVHTGPGSNYPVLDILPARSVAEILPQPLAGVLATGTNWWPIQYSTPTGTQTGWISSAFLRENPIHTTPAKN